MHFPVTYWCCWPTLLQSELTSQWEHRWSWHACVDSGGVRLAQRCGWTMVERFPKLCLHWSCLCCIPGPQDTLHSDHELASQLRETVTERQRERGKITHNHMPSDIKLFQFICICQFTINHVCMRWQWRQPLSKNYGFLKFLMHVLVASQHPLVSIHNNHFFFSSLLSP